PCTRRRSCRSTPAPPRACPRTAGSGTSPAAACRPGSAGSGRASRRRTVRNGRGGCGPCSGLLVFGEAGDQRGERRGRMALEAALVHVDETIGRPALPLQGRGGLGAPLAQARHLLRQVELLAALGFDDPDGTV